MDGTDHEAEDARAHRVARVFSEVLDSIQDEHFKLARECEIQFDNPVKDVIVRVSRDKVTVSYDGAGYNYFSPEGGVFNPMTDQWVCTSTKYRELIDQKLKEIDPSLYAEDVNSWMLSVHLG